MSTKILIIVFIALAGITFIWFGGDRATEEVGNDMPDKDPVSTSTDDDTDIQTDQPAISYTNADASLIVITSPTAGAEVGETITLSGEARGYWFFEATAPVRVVDWDGRIIGEGYITADGEWMTEDLVSFSGTISYSLPEDAYSTRGTVIFQKSNPSDLPENDAAVEVPVILTKTK